MSLNNWKEVTIGELGEVITGKTPKTTICDNYGGDIPFLTPSDNLNNKFIETTARTLSNKGLKEVENKLLPINSVCISCIGSDLGKVVRIKKPCVTNQQINSIIVNEKLFDTNYIYYSMILIGKKLNFISKTSTAVPIINKTNFSNFKIKLPPLEEQKAIAHTLSLLDDKIELNLKINATLEEMAQAIFKNWFVDFEPFKDGEFIESELGLIPKGWVVGNLGDVIELFDNKRRPLSKKQRENMSKNYPYYGATSLMDYVEDYIFEGAYILLGEDGTVIDDKDKPVLQYVWGKFWANNHAHVIQSKNGYSLNSLYLLLKNLNVKSVVTGAVQPKINQSNLKSLKVIIPDNNILKKYNHILEPIFEKYKLLVDETETLKNIRDTLLPKLMSGELDLSQIINK